MSGSITAAQLSMSGRHVSNRTFDSVEKVQRRFTKRLKGLSLESMTYAESLRYLDVPSLELRRLY